MNLIQAKETLYNCLYYVGEEGNIFLIIIAAFALYWSNSIHYLGLFVIGSVFNILFNFVLKGIIRSPRPNEDAYLHSVRDLYKPLNAFGKFGMPSGHTQGAFFTLTFLYLVTKNTRVTIVASLITLVIMWQRVHGEFHSVAQVGVGAVVGFLVAYTFVSYGKLNLKGKQKAKSDDNYFGLGDR